MTSIEKLIDIQYLINEFYSTEKDRNGLSESAKESRKIYNQDCRDIKKDLEVLEIIKKHIVVDNEEDEFPDFSIMFFEEDKADCDKLNNWLKNEEQEKLKDYDIQSKE